MPILALWTIFMVLKICEIECELISNITIVIVKKKILIYFPCSGRFPALAQRKVTVGLKE